MKKPPLLIIFGISILSFVLIACLVLYLLGPAEGEIFSTITEETSFPDDLEASMNLTSTAFSYGESIPAKYSCKGADLSPALAWDEPPAGTQSLALIMDDPDAPMGTWVHWVLFNLPAETRSLAENFQPVTPIIVGKNSWGKNTYGGPCPPSGKHRYFFKLYALDTVLNVQESISKSNLLAAMEGHILAQAELMGTFSK